MVLWQLQTDLPYKRSKSKWVIPVANYEVLKLVAHNQMSNASFHGMISEVVGMLFEKINVVTLV